MSAEEPMGIIAGWKAITGKRKIQKAKRASIAYMEALVVFNFYHLLSSFKLVSLSLSHISSILKSPPTSTFF